VSATSTSTETPTAPATTAGTVCIDGNEAAALVAYALSETVAIYPITPASPMGEFADEWAAKGRENVWGVVPSVSQLQSEAGAAGALHGAIQAGSLGVTFTASQGLLLMIPEMFKIAGELTPTVIHVAARTVATHALSIFGDHSDVMAVRPTGWVQLSSSTPQEAHDLAAVSHAATLETRLPFLHFMDGFRTSHELNVVAPIPAEQLRALVDDDALMAHRARGLDPDRPVLRGSAQNPDVFFQAREAINPFYAAVPAKVQEVMDRLAAMTGRHYGLVEYHGAPDAERVVVLMGSAVGPVRQTVDRLNADGDTSGPVGLVHVRLYRPFPTEAFLAALPASARRVLVLDRTKEPGAAGEPLFEDVVTTLAEAVMQGARSELPQVHGARYGLASKEFTPAMVAGLFDELAQAEPRRRMTAGIIDDVTHLSVLPREGFAIPAGPRDRSAVFFGLGSDGTVGANKNTTKIVGDLTDLHVQGYFVYDSKKSGATTVSHLRFSPDPIHASYLIERADLVACHQFGLLEKLDVTGRLKDGGILLLNAPFPPDQLFAMLPGAVRADVVARGLEVHAIDAYRIARDVGLGGRINTVMQAAFFALADLVEPEHAIGAIEDAIRKSYGSRGEGVVDRNLAAVAQARDALVRVPVPADAGAVEGRIDPIERALALMPAGQQVDDFVRRVTARMLEGEGDLLPVSALPVDGTFPTATSRYEKRSLAPELPIWDPDLCIDCGKCAIVCPHTAIQMKAYEPDLLDGAPDVFLSKEFKDRSLEGHLLTVQVAPDDCTGCGVCVEMCPAVSRSDAGRKAIRMEPADEHRDEERVRYRFFDAIPHVDRSSVRTNTVKHSQLLQPLFEASGACAGCGETPYLKLLSQLYGDRSVIANATGCSSIYGGNLPTTPWSVNAEGRGPAWANSLFEDNAEFGFGIRLGLDQQRAVAVHLLTDLAGEVGDELVDAILEADQHDEASLAEQRARVVELRTRLAGVTGERSDDARRLTALAGALVRRDVWIVGGDGWAYDIGFGGLDHVLASGADVNILVLDTEVYSNTGGQASKATSKGAVAKYATSGKAVTKKDLGLIAMQYGSVYVAQIAMGANEMQTVKAFHEAAAWPGPSLLLAYSTCIAHGVDMRDSMKRMDLAVRTGYWPLFRYHPAEAAGTQPFRLDSKPPSLKLREMLSTEGRFAMLERSDPERSAMLRAGLQRDVDERWRYYEQLAGLERRMVAADAPPEAEGDGPGEDPGAGPAAGAATSAAATSAAATSEENAS
jgi:pyruvate-ferredoxin/flavodoxin oxidoreductase